MQQGDFRFLLLAAVAQHLLLHVTYHCGQTWHGTSVINCRPEFLYQLTKSVNLTMHSSMFTAKSIMEVHFELWSLKMFNSEGVRKMYQWSSLVHFGSIQNFYLVMACFPQCQYSQRFLIPGSNVFFSGNNIKEWNLYDSQRIYGFPN